MTKTASLGVAVVGLGVGEQHARAFARHPACRLAAVADLEATRAQKLAAEFDGCGVASDFDSLLGRNDIDIISIATFDDHHYEQVVKALRAGKHVFVEKPLCRTDAEVKEIRRLLTEAGGRLKLAENLVLRAAPLYQWLRHEIGTGSFGDIYAFDGDYLYGRLHKITEGWRSAVDDYSVMLGGGIHLLDLMLWLTGQRPEAVTAVGNRICTKESAFRFNDFLSATLHFKSSMVARITANFGCVHGHQHVMRIFGTRRTFLLDDAGPRLMETRDPDVPAKHLDLSPLPENKGVLIPDFVTSVVQGGALDLALLDGITIAAACDRAAASGNKERISYT